MKLQQRNNTLTTNALETGQFTIETNSKAFTLLVGNLYADKPVSITREIWSNAYDSHKDAGKGDVPFEVTFPSVWESTFRCRDFGVGLSHEDVMGLYTTVFKSTKEDSNTGVGKWGLGSKSPFAYTDTFTVTSWYGGKVSYYSAAIGEDGVPRINLMGSEPSTEPNGLEVAFPVKSADVELFRNAANRVSMGFDVKPKVTNPDRFNGWPEFKVKTDGKGYKIIETEYGSPFANKIWAKMGCVIYPINVGSISGDYSLLNQMTAILEFDIGELDVTGSREELSYDEQTSKAIKSRLDGLVTSLLDDSLKKYREVEAKGCPFDMAKAYYEISGALNHSLRNEFQKQSGGSSFIDITDNGLNIDHGLNAIKISSYRITSLEHPKFDTSYSIKGDDRIYYESGTTIFVEDTRKGKRDFRAGKRLKNYLSTAINNINIVIWIRLVDDDCDKKLNKFLKILKYPVVYIKDITDPGADKKKSKPVSLKYIHSSYGNLYDYQLTTEDIEKPSVYSPLFNNDYAEIDGENKPKYTFNDREAWHDLVCLGVIDKYTTHVAVPKTHWKKFIDNKWKTVWQVYKDMVEKHKKQLEKVASQVDHTDKISDILKLSGKCKSLVEYQKEPDYVLINGNKVGPTFAREILFKYDGKRRGKPVDKLLTEIKNYYPMLSSSGYALWAAQEYVNLIDERKKT